MSSKQKWMLLAGLLVLPAVIGFILLPEKTAPIITLPNGDQYEIAGMGFGKDIYAPSRLASVVRHLPLRYQARVFQLFLPPAARYNQHILLGTPEYVIWFRHRQVPGVVWSNVTLYAMLADAAGDEGGRSVRINLSSNVVWPYASFLAIPRRSRNLQLNLHAGALADDPMPVAQISVPNPFYGQFPEWPPEPVPIVKSSSDLQVTLTKFEVSTPRDRLKSNPNARITPFGATGLDAGISLGFRLDSPRGTNEIWIVSKAELSDATGNVISNVTGNLIRRYQTIPPNGVPPATFSLTGTLWPDETAWRLKVSLARVVGLPPEELVTFTNVPVPPPGMSNQTRITNFSGTLPIVITGLYHNPVTNLATPFNPATFLNIELSNAPPDLYFDFLKMNTDAGAGSVSLVSRMGVDPSGRADYQLRLDVPRTATNANITLIVQKLRTVEFLVKPPQPN